MLSMLTMCLKGVLDFSFAVQIGFLGADWTGYKGLWKWGVHRLTAVPPVSAHLVLVQQL